MAIIKQTIPPEKDERLKQISRDTLSEVLEKLYKNNRVLVVRPTGFGKSYLLAGLTSALDEDGNRRFKKCLYVYPTDVIKEDVIKTYSNLGNDSRAGMLKDTVFISYKKITNMIDDLEKTGKTVVRCNIYVKKDTKQEAETVYTVGDKTKNSIISEINGYLGKNGLREWFRQFDLVMLDECHKTGSNGFLAAWDKVGSIITSSEKTKLVGVTATPDRLDGIDIKEIFGKQNQISRLPLSECIREGLLQKFDYVYTIGNRSEYIETCISTLNTIRKRHNDDLLNREEITELYKTMDKIKPIHLVIRERVGDAHTGGSNYMKFVVFFDDSKHIKEKHQEVINWFSNAFPDMEVNHKIVINKTDNDMEIAELDVLDKLVPRENVIDLIFCIDMLNMGYHVESITGVMLLRHTTSAVIYNQQIGRCFSVRSMNKPIIFDIVDKLNGGIKIKGQRDALESENKAAGVQKDLPSILNKDCVDSYNTVQDLLVLANKMKKKDFNMVESICWMYEMRNTPVEILSYMANRKVETILNILITHNIKIADNDKENLLKKYGDSEKLVKLLSGEVD